ncbi:hypothetical protein L484_003335 [Morus notabilis]|uniref:Uncharacterized protein n=1 Tax=Morus notabilis TaxID=981085 RepID=W9R9R6_9ROSA|nr:hypothetical protein L484_003335 [Morus notabilis]
MFKGVSGEGLKPFPTTIMVWETSSNTCSGVYASMIALLRLISSLRFVGSAAPESWNCEIL